MPAGLGVVASATLWLVISAGTFNLKVLALVAAPQLRTSTVAKSSSPPQGTPELGPDQLQARALFEEGLRNLEQNRYEQAIEGFQRSLKLDPTLLTARYDLGVAYFSRGQFDQAKQAFQEVLRQSPRHQFARYFLGRVHLVQGNPEAAVHEFRAISGERPVADELYYLGSAYFRRSDVPEAIRTLKRAATWKPEDYRIHLLLARALERDGQSAEAGREYAVSEQLRAEYRAKARDMTECESLLQKRDAAAIERCQALLDGNDETKLTSLGTLLAEHQFYEQALIPLEKATRLQPDDYEPQFNLGLTYYKMKRYQDAKGPLETAAALRPESFDALALLGSLYFALGEDLKAAKYLRHAHQLHPDDTKIQTLLFEELRLIAQHLFAEKQYKDSTPYFEEALTLKPEATELRLQLAEAYEAMGKEYFKLGDPKQAVPELQKALQLDPGNEDYVLELALVFVTYRAPEAAVRLLEAARERFARSPSIWFGLGLAYLAGGRYTSAESALMKSLDLDPTFDLGLEILAQCYLQADDWPKLRQTSDRLLELNPRNPKGYYYKALALLRNPGSSNQDEQAIEVLLRRAIELGPEIPEPRNELAKLMARRGDKEASIRELETIVHTSPDFGPAHYQLSRLYLEKGDKAGSEQERKQYEKIRLNDDEITMRRLLVEVHEGWGSTTQRKEN